MLSDLLQSKNYMDIYKVARWAYKVNAPILEDYIYDKCEEILKNMFPDDKLFKTSYEDDEEPTDLLSKYNITLQNTLQRKANHLIGDKSNVMDTNPISQKPVRSKQEAYQWYKRFSGQVICHSLKVDGISTRTLLSKKTTLVQESYSKGRSNSITDFTTTVKTKLNAGYLSRIKGSEGNNILVAAEGIIDNKGVDLINTLSQTAYKNGRSAALGILATDINERYLPHLHLFAFGFSNPQSTSYSESLKELTNLGFEQIPMIVSTFIDEGFDSFSNWIDDITGKLKQKAFDLDIQADGVVARLDNYTVYNRQFSDDLYSDGSIALKFNEFRAKAYLATVKDIVFEFQGSSSENLTAKLILDPITTDDNKSISKITGYNLAYIMNKGIKKGSTIEVLYQSGCYPMLG